MPRRMTSQAESPHDRAGYPPAWQRSTRLAAIGILVSLAACASPPELTKIAAGTRLLADGGRYSLFVQGREWGDMGSETVTAGEQETSLRIASMDGSSVLLGIETRDHQPSMDDYVARRRAAFLAEDARDYRERRSFLGSQDEVTASLSRYVKGREVLLILTAIRTPVVVELFGTTVRGAGGERDLIALMESIEIDALDGKERP